MMDYRWFVFRKRLYLEDIPPFPLDEFLHQMSPKVSQVVATVYLANIVGQLQGRYEYEPLLIVRYARRRKNNAGGVQATPHHVLKTTIMKEEFSDE
jgi:hypothetical protein